MPQGLQVFDENGNITLDLGANTTRIIDVLPNEDFKKTYKLEDGQKIWVAQSAYMPINYPYPGETIDGRFNFTTIDLYINYSGNSVTVEGKNSDSDGLIVIGVF